MRTLFGFRVFIIPAVLMLMVLLTPYNLAAAEALVLSVNEEIGEAGGEVTVAIDAVNAANTEGGQFLISFDPELVSPVSIEAGSLITDSSNSLDMANLEFETGQLMFIWVTPAADTADSGTLCTITFKLLKEGESLLKIDEVVISPDGVELVAEPGTITVEGNGLDPAAEQEGYNEVDPDPAVEEEELVDQDRGPNTLLIGLIVLVVLAVTGFVAYKGFKKPGA